MRRLGKLNYAENVVIFRAKAPVVDYGISVIVELPVLAGTLVSVSLNRWLPDLSLKGLLLTIVCVMTVQTYRSGRRLYIKETRRNRALTG